MSPVSRYVCTVSTAGHLNTNAARKRFRLCEERTARCWQPSRFGVLPPLFRSWGRSSAPMSNHSCKGSFCPACPWTRLPVDSVLVLDNARIHHGGQIEALVQKAGCSLLYLPAYSPDFSPIELAWSWVKSRVRGAGPRDDATRETEITQALEALPVEHAGAWFGKCGYLQT